MNWSLLLIFPICRYDYLFDSDSWYPMPIYYYTQASDFHRLQPACSPTDEVKLSFLKSIKKKTYSLEILPDISQFSIILLIKQQQKVMYNLVFVILMHYFCVCKWHNGFVFLLLCMYNLATRKVEILCVSMYSKGLRLSLMKEWLRQTHDRTVSA